MLKSYLSEDQPCNKNWLHQNSLGHCSGARKEKGVPSRRESWPWCKYARHVLPEFQFWCECQHKTSSAVHFALCFYEKREDVNNVPTVFTPPRTCDNIRWRFGFGVCGRKPFLIVLLEMLLLPRVQDGRSWSVARLARVCPFPLPQRRFWTLPRWTCDCLIVNC